MSASQDEWLKNWVFDAPNASSTQYYLLLGDDAYGYASSVKDEDCYKFRVDIGSAYRINVYDSTPFGNSDTGFYLLDRRGNIVSYTPDTLEFIATDTLYYILTSSGAAGYYRLRAENLSVAETVGIGENVQLNQTYSAALDCNSDSDHFSFSGIAGHSYAISFTTKIQDLTLRISSLDPYLPVDVNTIAANVYTFDALNTGVYDLSTFSYNLIYKGDYSFQLQDANCKPVFVIDHPLDGVAQFLEGGAAVILDTDVAIADIELDALNNYNGASLKLVRHRGANSDDLFSGAGIVAGQASGDVTLSNTVIGSYSWINGTLLISFNDQATSALVNQLLVELSYNNGSDKPPVSIDIDWIFSDGNIGEQGLGGARVATGTSQVVITAVNDAPTAVSATIIAEYNVGYIFNTSSFGFSDIDQNTLAGVKILTLPQAGQLLCDGNAVLAGDEVSAADINSGKFSFIPEPGVVASNYADFDFQVRDDGGTAHGGVDLSLASYTLTIDLKQVNHAPSGTDALITLEQSGTHTFTLDDFGFNDKDNDTFLRLRITAAPNAGHLYLIPDLNSPDNKTPIFSYSEIDAADIAAGKLIFEPDKGFTGSPYTKFTFQVRDNGGIADGGVDLDPTPNTMTFNVTPAPSKTLPGTANSDELLGGAGDDILIGYGSVDKLQGWEGSDQYIITQASEHLGAEIIDTGIGIMDVDTLWFTAGKASILTVYAGDTGLERICLGTLNVVNGEYQLTQSGNIANSIDASALNYGVQFWGNDAANTIKAGRGNDVLNGGLGADKLYGGAGSDTYWVELTAAGVLADAIVEGANGGFDTIVVTGVSTNPAYKKLVLANSLENLDISRTEHSLLNVFGNAGFNTLIGNAADNVLDGGGSGDDMLGGAGNDTYIVDSSEDWVYETTTLDNHVDAGGIDQVKIEIAQSNGTYTLPEFVENAVLINRVAFDLEGNELNNALIGNKAANRLNGEGGDDVLTGGLGLDTFVIESGQDTITDLGNGGSDHLVVGQDALVYATVTAAWTATVATQNLGTVLITTSGKAVNLQAASTTVTLPGNPDPIILAAQGYTIKNIGVAASIIGSGLDDILIGGSGNDQLAGGDGHDVLMGGKGGDSLSGGHGSDVFRFADGDSSSGVVDTLLDFEIGTGNKADWIDYSNALSIGGSNALADKDHASIDDQTAVATFAAGEGLTLADAINDVVNSFGLANPQEGNFAFFKVNHLGYYYLLIKAATGNLLMQLSGISDIGGISLLGGDLSITTINQTLYGGNDNDVLIGGAGDDVLLGGGGDDTLSGGLGVDSFIVTAGQDTVTDLGLGGADILTVSAGAVVNATVLANWTATADSVNDGTVWINTTGNSVDVSKAGGTIGFIIFNDGRTTTLIGSVWADVLSGGKAVDVLKGGEGDDVLIGNKGQDQLEGGGGLDTFQFAAGDAGIKAGTLDKILDYQSGDLIDYTVALRIGGVSGSATNNQAAIDSGRGVASFAPGSGGTLADAVHDIAASFSAASSGDKAGDCAFFQVNGTGDYYLYISDGKKGAGTQDVLIQLVGVQNISGLDNASGDLNIFL